MEHLNKIEIRGNVGNIRIIETSGNQMARISVATNYAYKTKDGTSVIETTWHNVVAWAGRGMIEFERITKGCVLYVIGRMKSSHYTGSDGLERQGYEVVASRIEIVPE